MRCRASTAAAAAKAAAASAAAPAPATPATGGGKSKGAFTQLPEPEAAPDPMAEAEAEMALGGEGGAAAVQRAPLVWPVVAGGVPDEWSVYCHVRPAPDAPPALTPGGALRFLKSSTSNLDPYSLRSPKSNSESSASALAVHNPN